MEGTGTLSGTVRWNSCQINETAVVTVATIGALTFTSGVNYAKLIYGNLTNDGTITWQPVGTLTLGGVLHNLPGAPFDAQVDNTSILKTGSDALIINDGMFRKSAGTSGVSCVVPAINNGTVEIFPGTLLWPRPATLSTLPRPWPLTPMPATLSLSLAVAGKANWLSRRISRPELPGEALRRNRRRFVRVCVGGESLVMVMNEIGQVAPGRGSGGFSRVADGQHGDGFPLGFCIHRFGDRVVVERPHPHGSQAESGRGQLGVGAGDGGVLHAIESCAALAVLGGCASCADRTGPCCSPTIPRTLSRPGAACRSSPDTPASQMRICFWGACTCSALRR